MNAKHIGLKLGSSALASAFALTATSAWAQDAGAMQTVVPPAVGTGQTEPPSAELQRAEQTASEIVITGTSIRGVAPVGSNLVSVGQDALQKVAATTVTELVNTVPAISTANSTPQAQSAYSYYAPQIHQLGGSGSNTTLSLIDGLRMPGAGLQYAQTDPNIIPSAALQRVEVLADGASSIYGSDAVAGVVNFITRKRFDGAELNGRIGFADNYKSYDLNGIWGKTWDTGGFYVASQYIRQQQITNDKRDFLSLGDYRPARAGDYPGRSASDINKLNTNTFACSPATIRGPAGSNIANSIVDSVDSTNVRANDVAANGFCNNSVYGSAVPGVQRETAMVVLTQDIGDRLNFTGKMVFNHLKHYSVGAPGTLTNVNAYGSTVAGRNVAGQVNPFFRAPATSVASTPGANGGLLPLTQEIINYVALRPGGDYGTNNYKNVTYYGTAVLEYKITDRWTATLSGDIANSDSYQRGSNTFCSTCATLAINGSPNPNGNQIVAVRANQTATVAQTLTSTNALDIWNGLGTNRTSAATWNDIYSAKTNSEHQNNMYQGKLEVQGPLFEISGGDVRMAAGLEYMHVTQDVYGTSLNSTGTGYTQFVSRLGPRNVKSAYLELYVPVINEDMNVPLVQKFDVSLSGRIDHYSDFGSTKNPKFAANWQVNDWIRLRGNYAESFVAPPLNQIGDANQGYLRNPTGTGSSAAIDAPFSVYPNLVNVPGCAAAQASGATTCRIGIAGRDGLDRSLGAGFAGVVPQTGKSWSVGLDLNPRWLPGFTANVTFWTNQFRGGVVSPAQPLIINSSTLKDRLVICSTAPGVTCSQSQIDTFTNVANGATVSPTLPSPVYFLINRDVGNVLDIDVQGIDAQVQYRVRTARAGAITIGATGTYFTKFKQSAPGGQPFDLLNTSGYNSQFPSIQTRIRGQLGWEIGGLAIDAFANYTGKYRNYIQTSVIPVSLDDSGNPSGGGDLVKRDLTFDLHAAFNFAGGFLDGQQIYLDVKNVFDKDPPFYNGNTTGAGGVGAWGFNGFTSNLLGRVVSVGFRASFK